MSGPIKISSKTVSQSQDKSNTVTDDLQQSITRFISWISEGTEVAADADNVSGHTRSQIPHGAQVHLGVVHYAIPGFGAYRVCLFGLGGLIRCRDGRGTVGLDDVGQKSMLPPGAHVYVAVHEHASSLGTIIGVKPQLQNEAGDAFCDFVVQGSGVGLYASPYYADYVAGTIDAAGAKPYAGDYPRDGLSGDYTVMATSGVGLHIDSDMTYLRTSELCGLFLFREDGYTRLTGETLATESLAVRSETGMSAAELFETTGHSIYPWESLGQAQPGMVELEQYGVAAIYDGSTATTEPADLDAVPIDRLTTIGGYLGQGQLTTLVTPTGVTTGQYNTLSNPVAKRALFRQQIMLDGTYMLESARQMFFAKAVDIPIISQKSARDYLAEDEQYKASGMYGEGDPHTVSQLRITDPAAAAAGASEAYAYASAWQGYNAAVYHPHIDLEYPTPGDDGAPGSLNASLDGSDRVSPPPVEQVDIDHRYGQVDIHRVLSLFAFLPDGTIVIRDGFGAELRMNRGVVELGGTGVYVNAGRTFSLLGGQVSIRGNRGVEVVSANNAVRIKAETNLMLLGGNGGRGGVLIESRGVGTDSRWPEDINDVQFGGVTIKAASSYVAVYGGDLLLKSGTSAAGLFPGRVVIDATQSTITMRSHTQHRYAGIMYDNFVNSEQRVNKSNVYAENFVALSGSLGVSAQILGGGGIQVKDSVVSLDGWFGCTNADALDYKVGTVKEPAKLAENIKRVEEEVEKATDQAKSALDDFNRALRTPNKPLDDATIRNTGFGFPSSEGYRSQNVTLSQPYWQQALAVGQTWNEPIVRYRERQPTRPWPGNERQTEGENGEGGGYVELTGEQAYFNHQLQRPIDPTDNRQRYEEATPPITRNVSILSGLKTIF